MASMMFENQIPMGQSCSPHSFQYPTVFGAEFTNIQASLVTNQTVDIPPGMYWSHHARTATNLNYCNVTVTYTHPGQNDNLNVQVWLPIEDWNERLQGSGGGGYQAGSWLWAMAGAVNDGYAVTSTDSGHELGSHGDASPWALLSPGNVDLYALQNFASVSLDEASRIGKQITTSFYGRPPKYSYWNGCSTGGRQGLMLAQRYPDAFDGILAAAPAINWASFLMAEYWPQLIMNEQESYPHPCEFNAITSAAISHCDELDGVQDGIISLPDLCTFDPTSLIGNLTFCPDLNTSIPITKSATLAALAAWTGPQTPNGTPLWPGLSHDAVLPGPFNLVGTTCQPQHSTNCTGAPFSIALSWMTLFLERGSPTFDPKLLTRQSYVDLFHKSVREFASLMSANSPYLAPFKAQGGKMLTWHGLADQVIFPNGSRNYYERVKEGDAEVEDYYRYFEAPGVAHCGGGAGPVPGGALEALVRWVEEGVAPDVLEATSLPDEEGKVWERGICMYPRKAKWTGSGDVRSMENWECV